MRIATRRILGTGKEEFMLLYRVGRVLQVLGMIVLPVAIAGNLAPEQPLDLRQSLTLSGIGVGVFAFGYLLQQIGRPK
jgi:drug/metabolite transporter (DMT)-like permease